MPRQKTTEVDRFQQLALLDARENPDIGFSTSLLAQIAWPVDDPGDVERWSRRNGNLLMIIEPGSEPDGAGGLQSTLVPFGVIPRYLSLYACTEIKRTGEQELNLGASFAGFLRKLGLRNTGGENGARTAVKAQMNRWLNATISFVDDTKDMRYESKRLRIHVSDGYDLKWMNSPDGATAATMRGDSKILFTPRFVEEVLANYHPVDIGAVRAIKGVPLRFDLFMWLNWRNYRLDHPVMIPWDTLRPQFGTTDSDDKDARYNFKRSVAAHIRTIKRSAWPELRAEATPDGLQLKPSQLQLPRKGVRTFVLEGRQLTADQRYAEAVAEDKGLVVHRAPTRRPRTRPVAELPAAADS